jgi:hypothetical protein
MNFAGCCEQLKRWPVAMVALRKELDLVWVWFYKVVAPTALKYEIS